MSVNVARATSGDPKKPRFLRGVRHPTPSPPEASASPVAGDDAVTGVTTDVKDEAS